MKKLAVLVAVLGLSLPFAFASKADDAQKSKRIEEMFMWKVSDSLDLTPAEEQSFSRIMKEVRDDKSKYDQQLADTLQQIEKEKDPKKQAKLIESYRSVLKQYSSCHLKEVDELEKLLGTQRLAKYLVVKEQLISKLKNALTDLSRGQEASKKIKDPKVVQEK